jgi:hypothetical protein
MKRKLTRIAVTTLAALALLAGCESPVQDLQRKAEAKWGPQGGWTERQKMAYLAGLQTLMGSEAQANEGYAEQMALQSVASSINTLAMSNNYVHTPYGVYTGGAAIQAGMAQGGAALGAGIARAAQGAQNQQAAEAVMLTLGGN